MTCQGCKDRAKGVCDVSVGRRRGEPVLTTSGDDYKIQFTNVAAGARAVALQNSLKCGQVDNVLYVVYQFQPRTRKRKRLPATSDKAQKA